MMTMTHQNEKYKKLVKLCVITKNTSKITLTTLSLIHELVKAHGMKLGLVMDESALINELMERNNRRSGMQMSISLYPDTMIKQVKIIEALVKKTGGYIPEQYLKNAISVYFDLQKITIPSLPPVDLNPTASSRILSLFRKGEPISPVKRLLYHQLDARSREIKSQLSKNMDEKAFIELQEVNQLRASLNGRNSAKIQVAGALSEDARYRMFFFQSKAFVFLGIGFLLLVLTGILLTETTLDSHLLAPLGMFLLLFIVGTLMAFYLYFNIKRRLSSQW